MIPQNLIKRFVAKHWIVKIKGLTDILYNNEAAMVITPKKARAVSYEEHEQQYWLNKGHYDEKEQCILPDMWFKKSAIASQGQSAVPIKPPNGRKANDTLKNYLTAAVVFMPTVVYKDAELTVPYMKKDLAQYSKGVNRGTPSSPKKVIVVRPAVVTPWHGTIDFTDLEGKLTLENIYEIFQWAGTRNGLGDWRMQRGGQYGAYQVVDIVEG